MNLISAVDELIDLQGRTTAYDNIVGALVIHHPEVATLIVRSEFLRLGAPIDGWNEHQLTLL